MLHRGESVPLLSLEVADSLFRKRMECLLYTEETGEGVSSRYKRESFPLPFVEEADSVSIQRGECFFLHKAESVPLLYAVEADSFSVQCRDCLLYTSERVSLCHM